MKTSKPIISLTDVNIEDVEEWKVMIPSVNCGNAKESYKSDMTKFNSSQYKKRIQEFSVDYL